MKKIISSGGKVFTDLGFPQEEVAVLSMCADLMAQLRLTVEKRNWTQVEAAQVLGISQSRVSDLMRGKWDNSAWICW